jgi:3',5'-cyclic AMP phosphodiesterase CpdA
MSTFRLVQISDTHLSRSHAYFQDNWEACITHLCDDPPDLVVLSGDIAFNAPDVPDDLAFAREQFERLPVPWLVIPGNHDVGEPGENPRLGQKISSESIAIWKQQFETDCFCHDAGHWRFIGLNSEVLGSGLPEEAEQWAYFANALATRDGRQIMLFVHKPLYVDDPSASNIGGACIHPEPRARLIGQLREAGARLVTNGHHHAYHHSQLDEMHLVWAPTTAFINPSLTWPVETTVRAGLIEWQFSGDEVTHELIEPGLVANIDITNWTRTSGTSISLPPRALRG